MISLLYTVSIVGCFEMKPTDHKLLKGLQKRGINAMYLKSPSTLYLRVHFRDMQLCQNYFCLLIEQTPFQKGFDVQKSKDEV